MKLYTIGFTQKNAATFFGLLKQNGIQQLVDIRINPHGQLAGFAKQEDLPYFLEALADHCRYTYMPTLAPTKELLAKYHEDKDWSSYVPRFEALMDERGVPAVLDRANFETTRACLLCSEALAEKCHRSLVAERLARSWPHVEIIHL